ncbi:unnamed protein product [Miscanthus lutarioriparius]|uniref:Uncharacterized protein n=1 Tax=Miscanthus lutarioriparius TaxID=422564 RepID=A0A811RZ58_9POAL|nr:unnamed protein product [Miscanthus lutarioriparius]
MAAQMLSSAVAQEAVSQALSNLKERYGNKSDGKEHMERMVMAHIKLEAALETSNKWNITSLPLLRWQSKLKRAVQECDHTCAGASSAWKKRRTDNTGRGGGDNELTGSAVRRFGAVCEAVRASSLRYVELGGTPRQYMFFDPIIRHLLSGKGTRHCSVHGAQHLSFLLQPFSLPEHGMEGMLIFLLEDGNAPENNFFLSLSLRLSESTNIVGVVIRCLELFTPHMSSIAETVKTKLTQLPTQDFCWMPDAAYSVFGSEEHWEDLHTIRYKWFRPNPLCCQQKDLRSMNQITQVHLLGQVALLVGDNRQSAIVNGETCPMRGSSFLKLGGTCGLMPLLEDMLPAVGGSSNEMINREVAPCGLYANISFEQLGEIMLPKAEDCLGGNVAATSYQMLWNSKHGSAYLQADKTPWPPIPSGRRDRGGKNQKQSRFKKVQRPWTSETSEFLSSWILHALCPVQASFVDWIENKRRPPLPLSSKSTSCVHGCPMMSLSLPDYHASLARKIRSYSTFIALRT